MHAYLFANSFLFHYQYIYIWLNVFSDRILTRWLVSIFPLFPLPLQSLFPFRVRWFFQGVFFLLLAKSIKPFVDAVADIIESPLPSRKIKCNIVFIVKSTDRSVFSSVYRMTWPVNTLVLCWDAWLIPKKTLMTTGCKPTWQVINYFGKVSRGHFNGDSKSFSLSQRVKCVNDSENNVRNVIME